MPRSALLLALAVAIAPTAIARAQCPPNYLGNYFPGPDGVPIPVPVFSDSVCFVPGQTPCGPVWKATWNHITGDAFCESTGLCQSEIGQFGDKAAFMSDDYVLTGPASPTPIAFTAILHVAGQASQGCRLDCSGLGCVTICTFGGLKASLGVGAQLVEASNNAAAGTLVQDLQLPLSKLPGEHFQLDSAIRARGGCGGAIMTSHLSFALPAGYSITSCYGYLQAGPTPTSRASWGRVKAIYR